MEVNPIGRFALVLVLLLLPPLCTSSRVLTHRGSILAETVAVSSISKACSNLTCPGTEAINYYLYSTNSSCVCAAPIVINLSLSSSDAIQPRELESAAASALSLNDYQVWLAAASPAASGQSVVLYVFRPDSQPWNTVDVAVIVDKFLTNPSILPSKFGLSQVVTASEGSSVPAPPQANSIYFPPGTPTAVPSPPPPSPSPPAPKSGGGGIKWWGILLIILAVLILAGLAVVAWLLLARRPAVLPKAEEEAEETKNSSGLVKSATMSKAKSTSEFGLKVQENFVKAMSLEEIIESTSNFDEANTLGAGGYGTVYKGVGPGGVLWAVKRAKNANEEGVEDFQNEVDVISKMSHRNLVRLLGYCDEKGEQILVYEFVSNGTLRQHIRPEKSNFAPLTFEQRLEIAVGSAEGLKYLHSAAEPAIIHRDIKCDNILLDSDMQAKVADFGVFKRSPTQPDKTMNTRVVGTPGYVDPEYYQTYKVTTKSDVYSFGVVLLELITGRPPIMEDPSVENESYMVTLSRWATPKIAAGKVETIVDPRLHGSYPRQALNMMAAITAMCVRRLGRDRPEMAEVATRLAEIKYFLKPSSGILEPVMNLFPDDRDEGDNLMDIQEEEEEEEESDDDQVPEFIPGATSGTNPYSTTDIAAPVSMVFSDR